MAPPLPALFDLNLTKVHVLMNDDVFGFEFFEVLVSGAMAASVEIIPESWPESYSLPDDASGSWFNPCLAIFALVIKEYGDGMDVKTCWVCKDKFG